MPRIRPTHTYEQIDCESGAETWRHEASYCIEPRPDEIVREEGAIVRVNLDSNAVLALPFEWSPDIEVALRHSPIPRSFAPHWEEIPIAGEDISSNSIPLSRFLDFELLERLFEDRSGFRYTFTVTAREAVNLDAFRDAGWITEDVHENEAYRRLQIVSQLSPRNPGNASLVLKNYPRTIGNLDDEIIWELSMFAGGCVKSWQIEIDRITQPFEVSRFRTTVLNALGTQRLPVLERIPVFLRRRHPESDDHPLTVVVTVPEIEPQTIYTIDAALRDPRGALYCPTGYQELDNCIRSTHLELLRYGIPVGPGNDAYQRVLAQLLLYRHRCASQQGYIDASVAQMTENQGFHVHLQEKLRHQLEITPVNQLFSEVDIGNSRVDLLIDDIPTELKLEDRRTASSDEIAARYERQAADYVARQGSPFGFLMVLDTILDRDRPTSHVSQDVHIMRVRNASGGSTVVVAIIVRIPRSASDHT